MQMENPVAGQRCVHIHATLDTSLFKLPTSRYAGGADHLANMMVFHKREHNTYAKHTSLQAQRQGSGMATKAVCNLDLVKKDEHDKLTFLGVTRDHMQNGEDAIQHPASAGMFAVCIDGVVTIRAPFMGEPEDLMPGDFLGFETFPAPIDPSEHKIQTFALKKIKGDIYYDPTQFEDRNLFQTGATTSVDLYDSSQGPVGRLVEWRKVPHSAHNIYNICEFRVNLCPFGPSYEMIDSGLNEHDPTDGSPYFSITYKLSNGDTGGTDIDNGPGTYALTWFDISAVQPTKSQARTPAKQAIIGTILEQTDLGSSMKKQKSTAASTKATPSTVTYNSLDLWKKSSHYQEMTSSAQKELHATTAKSTSSQSVHVLMTGSDTSVQPIKNATDFRKNVLPHCTDQYDIKHDGKTISVYVGVQTPTASAASPSKSHKKSSSQTATSTASAGPNIAMETSNQKKRTY